MRGVPIYRPTGLAAALAVMAMLAGVARGGHEVPIYPSYYPHEIVIEAVAMDRAPALLEAGKLHAYLGREALYSGEPPKAVRAVGSLGDFVIARVAPATAQPGADACTAIQAAVAGLADKGGFAFHPYPVTPFHGDFLYHLDRAEAAKARVLEHPAPAMPPGWSVAIERVDAAALLAGSATAVNGWLGPAWVRTGWFQAWRILGATLEGGALGYAAGIEARLEAGDYRNAVERLNLERELVGALAGNCHKRVAGYSVKSQFYSADFNNGVENIGFDAIAGLNSPIFARTVKLKDFPWNGWLSLGIDAAPQAAWNPIAGFGDDFGRLLWGAIGDPALLPMPYDTGWTLNRASDVQTGP